MTKPVRLPITPLASSGIDRMAERRADVRWQRHQLQQESTRIVPLWRSRCLLSEVDGDWQAVLLTPEQIQGMTHAEPLTFLGSDGERHFFAMTVNDAGRDQLLEAHDQAEFLDLRWRAGAMSANEAAVLAYAKALHYWQHRHAFCGTCGTRNEALDAGHRMRCENEDCGRETFPRIDPAVIMLIEHEGACLLGRAPNWPEGRFSTLAGFVEPGESLEDTVAREVSEEVGVRLTEIEYRGSQPWPFPASTMIGFRARAISRETRLNEEIEQVLWLTPEQLISKAGAGEIKLSPPVSIAFRLLEDWYGEQTGSDLLADLEASDVRFATRTRVAD